MSGVVTGAERSPAVRADAQLALRALVVLTPPALLTMGYLAIAVKAHAFAFDFEHAFWPAARHVLHGESPFPPLTRRALASNTAFVYPPFAAAALIPFAPLPVSVAGPLFTVLLALGALLTLYLVGVRDWRCYAAIFLWRPVFSGLQTANLSLLLALGAALVWRCRDRRVLAGLIAALVMAMKLFLWPLLIWLVATRRTASAFVAAAATVAFTFAAWAAIGFAELGDYIPMLRRLTQIERDQSYTPLVLGLKLGLGLGAAAGLGLLVGLAALVTMILRAHKGDHDGAFVLALVTSLLFSPVVWLHYYAILIVGVGILAPAYGWLWVLPMAVVLVPVHPQSPSWWVVPVLATFGALMGLAFWRRSPRAEGRTASREMEPAWTP